MRTVYRALALAREKAYGKENEMFSYVKDYLVAFANVNEHTTIVFEDEENRYKRLFVCPGVFLAAFAHCKPLLIMDGCHVKSKYGGM
jgi:hypothetical protein